MPTPGTPEWNTLLKRLQNNDKFLTTLTFGFGDKINDSAVQALSKALQKNKTLTELEFKFSSLSKSGVQALSKMLQKNNTLKILKLNHNQIDDSGAQALSKGLQQNKALTTLDLESNQIGDVGVIALSKALQQNKSLVSLSLAINFGKPSIGDSGAQALSEMLQQNNTLTSLNLQHNQIGVSGTITLSTALQQNKTLTSLSLFSGRIGDSGAIALSAALQKNNTLTSLALGNNYIGKSGAQALLTAIQKNYAITFLYLIDLDINSMLNATIATEMTAIDKFCQRNQLRTAAQNNDLTTVKSLELEKDVTPLSMTDDDENIPLHWAVLKGHRELTAYLINVMQEKNIPLTAKNIKGKTAQDLATDPNIAALFSFTSTKAPDGKSEVSTSLASIEISPIKTDKQKEMKESKFDWSVSPKEQTLKGHSDVVTALTVFVDGTLVSGSGTMDKTIKLWNPKTGQCLQTLTGHNGGVAALAVFADGILASGSGDSTIKLWNPKTGQCLRTFTVGYSVVVTALAVFVEGTLASCNSGNTSATIQLWDTKTGQCLQTLIGHSSIVYALAVFADGTLASGSGDSTIKLWNPKTGQCLQTLTGHSGAVMCLAVFADGTLASGGSGDDTIKLWNPKTGQCLQTLNSGQKAVVRLAVFADGTLASDGWDNTIKLWDPKTGQCLRTLIGGHNNSTVHSLAVLEDGIVASNNTNTIQLQSFPHHETQLTNKASSIPAPSESKSELEQTKPTAFSDPILQSPVKANLAPIPKSFVFDWSASPKEQTLGSHGGMVAALVIFADGTLASSGGDGTIKLWNPKTGQCLQTLNCLQRLKDRFNRLGSSYASVLVVLADGTLASGSNDNIIQLWDPKKGKCLKTLKGARNDIAITALAVLDNGTLAGGSYSDSIIQLWDPKKGKCLQTTLTGHNSGVAALAVFADGTLASGSADKTIKLWNPKTGQCLQTLTEHSGDVSALAVLPNGTLASGSADKTIKLWSPKTGQCLQTLTGHNGGVAALAVFADGTLASCSYGDATKLWNPKTGQCLQTLTGHSKYASRLAVFVDGTLAIGINCGSDDNTIQLYSFPRHEIQLTNKVSTPAPSDSKSELEQPKPTAFSSPTPQNPVSADVLADHLSNPKIITTESHAALPSPPPEQKPVATVLSPAKQLSELTQEQMQLTTISSTEQVARLQEEQQALKLQLQHTKQQHTELYQQLSQPIKSPNNSQLSQMQAQLVELESIQAALIADYDIKRARLAAEKAFQAHPNFWHFYRQIYIQLEIVFVGCKAVASEFMEASASGKLSTVASGLDIANTATQSIAVLGKLAALIPFIGNSFETILSGVSSGLKKISQTRQTNILKTLAMLGTLSEIKKAAEATARQLTECYRDEQLLVLPTLDDEMQQSKARKAASTKGKVLEGAKGIFQKGKETLLKEEAQSQSQALAQLVVSQVLAALLDGAIQEDQPLAPQFITAVTTPPSGFDHFKQAIIEKLGLNEVTTTDGRLWQCHAILIKPGIKTVQGHYFTGNHTDAKLYGYRLGTLEEAKLLDFQEVQLIQIASPPVPLKTTVNVQTQATKVTESYQSIQQNLRETTPPIPSSPPVDQKMIEELLRKMAQQEAELKALREAHSDTERKARKAEADLKKLKPLSEDREQSVDLGTQAQLQSQAKSQSRSTAHDKTAFGSPIHMQRQFHELQQRLMQVEISTAKHGEALQIPPEQQEESGSDEERQREELLGKDQSLQ